jgi:hypothetical protein
MECGSLLPPWIVCRIFRVYSKEKACLRLWNELISARFAINLQWKAAASCCTPRRLRRVIKNYAVLGETPALPVKGIWAIINRWTTSDVRLHMRGWLMSLP